uniref:CSON009520 protein n=1 Tax=Culicoides sonorensis TaxID=179676 RepID=A0A336LJL6_CULSO
MKFIRNCVNRVRRMKNLNILIWICWVVCLTQILALSTIYKSLPDIPANPALVNLVDSSDLRVETEINDHLDESLKNATGFVLLNKLDQIPQQSLTTPIPPSSSSDEIKDSSLDTKTNEDFSVQLPVKVRDGLDIGEDEINVDSLEKDELNEIEKNNTEDGTIPVFSEWAQKQMAEAEEKQKKQEEEQNGSVVLPKNVRQNGHKQQVVKLRAKNYASPDCGAKILASNSEAQSTGSVLTASKDEYLLSPCTSRIWFVVELCEPIQAEKIDLANFELFSSSPKNFSVAVSNRFPTRDWSNVGHFTAKDERDVQTFVLNPQLFGKFVRVDIQSHYNSEHYCPVSLFRVYGTSEFEAFETENQATVIATEDYSEEDEVEFEGNAVYEPSIEEKSTISRSKKNKTGKDEKNILKSAGEAVINMVKKVVKEMVNHNENQNKTVKSSAKTPNCVSLVTPFACNECSTQLGGQVQQLAACHNDLLSFLASQQLVIDSLTKFSNLCAIYVDPSLSSQLPGECPSILKKNYVTSLLPLNISIAICNKIKLNLQEKELAENVNDQIPSPDIIEETIDETINVEERIQTSTEIYDSNEKQLDISKEEKIFQNVETVQPEINDPNDTDPVQLEPILPLETPPTVEFPSENNQERFIDIPPSSLEQTSDDKLIKINEKSQEQDTKGHDEHQTHDPNDVNGNNSWENLETLIDGNYVNGQDTVTATPIVNQKQSQPESVFLRLSNRIKSLERNMSLSGQYLEELSRRYKKQVEELQQSFAKTLHHIEEQNRRNTDREQQLYEKNLQMRHDLNEVIETLQTWKTIVMYCGGFIVVQFIILYSLLRSCSRRNNLLTEALEASLCKNKKKKNKENLKRRKSIDGTLHISPAIRARRRPSEEALHIAGTYEDLLITSGNGTDEIKNVGSGSDAGGTDFIEVKIESSKKKKNKDKIRKTSTGSRVSKRSSSGDSNGGQRANQRDSPAEYDIKNGNVIQYHNNKPIEEIPYLEDNDEFIIPTASELSYNEYVPSMSSSQRINGLDSSISDTSSRSSNTKLDKSRRLSSPAFFKSALGRSSTRKSLPPVVQTSGWEWYRLRKSKAKSESPDVNSLREKKTIDSSGNSDDTSNKSKKTGGGSFRRILKKVF